MHPVLECPLSGKVHCPFPHYDPGRIKTGDLHRACKLHGIILNGKIALAQETENPSHYVAIKLIKTDSEEHRILTLLQSQGECTHRAQIKPHDNGLPGGEITRTVLKVAQFAIAFESCIHSSRHNILHRDIKLDNVLVSHFSDEKDKFYSESGSRRRLQRTDELHYCLFDFDISIMLPSGTDRTQYRLPYQESWLGTGWQPDGTAQREFNYDPFAFDVGTLGNVLCTEFQWHLCRDAPMLAPFLDRMTTRDIPKRFCAAEALKFFENFLPDIAATPFYEYDSTCTEGSQDYGVYDRWKDLSPEFIKQWEPHREPRIPH